MATAVQMAKDSPSESHILEKRPLDSDNVLLVCVDQDDTLHASKDLLDPGGRLVFGIGVKLEPHQRFTRLSHRRLACVSSVVFVEEGVGQSLQNTSHPLGVVFFPLALAIQLGGIVNEALNSAIFSTPFFQAQGMIVV